MRNTILNTEIEQKIKETKAILEMIDKELEHAPEGSLKIMRKADKSYYYHQIKQDNTYEKKYIEKKNEEIKRENSVKESATNENIMLDELVENTKYEEEKKEEIDGQGVLVVPEINVTEENTENLKEEKSE